MGAHFLGCQSPDAGGASVASYTKSGLSYNEEPGWWKRSTRASVSGKAAPADLAGGRPCFRVPTAGWRWMALDGEVDLGRKSSPSEEDELRTIAPVVGLMELFKRRRTDVLRACARGGLVEAGEAKGIDDQ